MFTIKQVETRDPSHSKAHIIVAGDPVNGFRFFGPFKDWDEAREMGGIDPYLEKELWWPAPLEPCREP